MPTAAELAHRPHAVYRHYAENGQLLYVGRSVNPDDRWRILRSQEPGWAPLSVRRIDRWYPTLALAKAAERWAIRTEGPVFNLQCVSGVRAATAGSYTRSLRLSDGIVIEFRHYCGRWNRTSIYRPHAWVGVAS